MKRALWLLAVAFLGLATTVVGRALSLRPERVARPRPLEVAVDADAAARRLAEAVRCPTVSHQDPQQVDVTAFAALREELQRGFPLVHARLSRESFGESLLYTWPGRDPAAAALVLMAHQDVVPAEDPDRWQHPPFSGEIADGMVWGRGTLDDKGSLLAILEAVELLLARGFQPEGTVWLAFGHDEEVGGRGARALAAELQRRGAKPGLVIDEGGIIVDGSALGPRPAALVGIAEKGFLSVELRVKGHGGHSSMPTRPTVIGRLSRAVARLEAHPLPPRFSPPLVAFLDRLAPEVPFGQRLALGNLWLFRPLVARLLGQDPATDALLRTTTAATIVSGGVKENVLASEARAVVNFRIVPGDDMATVLAHVRRVVDDPEVEVAPLPGAEDPPPVSPADGASFRRIAAALRRASPEPDLPVLPYVLLGASDARHFSSLTSDVYRVLPVRLGSRDLDRLHGIDERIPVAEHARAIRFYLALLLGE